MCVSILYEFYSFSVVHERVSVCVCVWGGMVEGSLVQRKPFTHTHTHTHCMCYVRVLDGLSEWEPIGAEMMSSVSRRIG